jgi:hypothetical protein
VIVNVCDATQPLESVTLQVQLPAVRPVTLVVPSPAGFPGAQSYVNPPLPPVAAFTDAAPFEPPLHDTFVCDAAETTMAGGCVMLNVAVDVHPLESVTVTV